LLNQRTGIDFILVQPFLETQLLMAVDIYGTLGNLQDIGIGMTVPYRRQHYKILVTMQINL
jgi:hypothetical protein